LDDKIDFTLSNHTIEELEFYSTTLKKDISTIIDEALQLYFKKAQEDLVQKSIEDEQALTNLDYDEFWSGVDIDD
jgi:hypothetical protein